MKNLFQKTSFSLRIILFLFVLLISSFFEVLSVQAASTDLTRTITITKKWEKDLPSFRPENITVHLKKTESTLVSGATLNSKMKGLSGTSASATTSNTTIQAIKMATDAEYEAIKSSLTSNNEVQSSGEKTYMWYSGGTIYIYSLADNIYMNSDSSSAFRKLSNLTDISGLAELNTTYVTDMNRMFQDSYSLEDISVLASWDVANVTNMEFMLGANYTGTSGVPMKISDLTPLKDWTITKVTNMDSMFKGCAFITTIAPLEDWIVSNLNYASQMFNRCESLTDFGTVFNNWNIVRVYQGSFDKMFGNVPGTLKIFNKRSGYWTDGTYTANKSAVSGYNTAIQIAKTKSANEQTSDNSGWVKNGDTWTYTFTVSNDGSKYQVWEDSVFEYNSTAYQDNPLKGVVDSGTITNSSIHYRPITVTKVWDNDLEKFRPSSITVHLRKDGTNIEQTSDPSKWTKNGNTWTYVFEVFDKDTYFIWEDNVPNYTTKTSFVLPVYISNDKGTIKNTLKRYNMKLVSKVVGNMAEIEKEIEYTVFFYDANGNPILDPFQYTTTGTVTSAENGVFKVKLRHDQQIVFQDVPIGYNYHVVKTSVIDYDELYEMEKADGTKQSGSTLSTDVYVLTENQTVTFFNGKREAVPTGVFLQRLPFVVLMILGLAGYAFIRYSSMKEEKEM